jgi:hypothetical protein
MARQRFSAALVAAAAAACLVPGLASAGEPRVPSDAPVVATSPAGARMLAFDHGRKLCTVFLFPGDRRRSGYPDCEIPRHSLRDIDLGDASDRRHSYHPGLVEPEVAAVELVFRGGRSVRVETSEGAAYQGRYAGKVRFLLAEADGGIRGGRQTLPRYLRLFDASGALLGIANADAISETRVGRPRELGRGSTGGARWSFKAFRLRALAPLPGQEERFVDYSCVAVERLGRLRRRGLGYPMRSYARSCMNPESRARSEYGLDRQCGSPGVVLTGIVEPDVRRVVAVLGDGRVRHVALRRLPASLGAARAFALVLPRSVAVRRMLVVKRDGRRVAEGGVGPGATRCGEDGLYAFAFGLQPAAQRGPLALSVYDDGVQLCATLGLPTSRPDECRYPPIDPQDTWILSRTESGRRMIAGIVASDVVKAVATLTDGRRLTLATRPPDAGYTGRYAGAVRFFTLELPEGTGVELIQVVDSRGRRTRALYADAEPIAIGPRRLVVDGPPGLRLRARRERVPGGSPFSTYLCISLGREECSGALAFFAQVRSDCDPRRLVFWGVLSRPFRDVTVETDRGTFHAHVRPLPRLLRTGRAGPPRWARFYQPVAAYVVAIPRRARPSALVLSGRRELRHRLRLPSASAQCGYDDFVSLGL